MHGAIAISTLIAGRVLVATSFSPHLTTKPIAQPILAQFTSESLSSTSVHTDHPPTILCVGETLWDSLPSGIYLGGAPTNVAMHLASLLPETKSVAVASCLGRDQLGDEAIRRLKLKGVRTDYVQFHSAWNTGMAIAMLDNYGDATYEFNTPAAWDGLQMNKQLSTSIDDENSSSIFIIGTIAARLQSEHNATSSATLNTIRNEASPGSVVLDVNLRSPWYEPKNVLQLARGDSSGSSKLALLKLNEDELVILEDWCGLQPYSNDINGDVLKDRMKQVASSLNAERICVTRGASGAALWCESEDSFDENEGYTHQHSGESDTVGAGDSFLAALVNSLFVLDEAPSQALKRACALGGFVASCRGAIPDHDDAPSELKQIFRHKC